jgi:hypothetical protein
MDGIVVHWTDQKSTIQFGSTTRIIHKTLEDVLFVDIIENEKKQEEIKIKPTKSATDISDLAQLKQELINIERQEYAIRATNHIPTITRPGQYGLPRFATIKNPLQHSREETPRENPGFGSALRKVFNKEHSED